MTLFACAGCHEPQPRPGHRCPSPPEGRIIPGQRIHLARAWTQLRAFQLAPMDCAERVILVVAQLVSEPGHPDVDRAQLAAAITEPDTIDLALDLLAEAGVPCA